jgi:hypothetical protein
VAKFNDLKENLGEAAAKKYFMDILEEAQEED